MSKEKFIEIYNTLIHREGADKLLAWLERSDFFSAPASTRFHGAYEGGLVDHSVNVFNRLSELVEGVQGVKWPDPETIAIVSLLHDVCKADFYGVEWRNRKNEMGQWEKYPVYVVDDQLPYGHGEKSVYIISGFMKLTREEAMAIRWHMGFGDVSFKGGDHSVGNAFEKYPLAMLLHMADMCASYLDESRGKQ